MKYSQALKTKPITTTKTKKNKKTNKTNGLKSIIYEINADWLI